MFCGGKGTTGGKDPVEAVVDDLVRHLKTVKDGADGWYKKERTRRNELAKQAANNNYNDGKELRLLDSSAVPGKLKEKYDHTKKWEHKFNNEWGGWDNEYAGYCHGQAKDFYYNAMIALKKQGLTVSKSSANLVSIFSNIKGLPNKGQTRIKIKKKSGYQRDKSVSGELHTKVAASCSTAADTMIAKSSAKFSAEIQASIRGNMAISNTAEKTEEVEIEVDFSGPFYIYQQLFQNVLGNGQTLNCWGSGGIIISPKPLT